MKKTMSYISLNLLFFFQNILINGQCTSNPAPWKFEVEKWAGGHGFLQLSPSQVHTNLNPGYIDFLSINSYLKSIGTTTSHVTLDDTLCIDDNFTLDVRLRNRDNLTDQPDMGYDAYIQVTLGNGVTFMCQLLDYNERLWAQSNTKLNFGSSSIIDNPNLLINYNNSAMLINGFQTVRLRLVGNTLFYSLVDASGNEQQPLSLTYNGTICKTINKISIWFKGLGEVDLVKVTNISNTITYLNEDFTSCMSYSGFPNCSEPNYNLSFIAPNCNSNRLQLLSNTNPLDSTEYSWTGPSGFSSNWKNPIINNPTPANTGTYTVNIKPKNPCEPNYTRSVNVNFPLLPTTQNVSQKICAGESYILPDGQVASQAGVYTSNIPHSIPGCTQTIITTVTFGNVSAFADTTICSPATIQLNATTNGVGYLWSPSTGLSDSLIANPLADVNASTTYTVTSALHNFNSPNLVQNPGFELGNSNFTSQYGLNQFNLGADLSYNITNNSQVAWNQFNPCASHSGSNMMVINGHFDSTNTVWCQNINIQPNTFYDFGFWAQKIRNYNNIGLLQFMINGVNVGPRFTLSNNFCFWQEYSTFWFSGNATNIDICIKNVSESNEPDFAIDDIWFKEMCTFSSIKTVTVQENTINITNTDISCFGSNNGTATALPTGIAPFQYSWSNSESTSAISNLSSGTYSVTVTDASNCVATASVTITEPNELISTITESASILCNEGETGIISNTSGGTGAYTYQWSIGATTKDINDIGAGSYSLQVTDENNCQALATITISEPDKLIVTTSLPEAFCEGNSTTIQAQASGGVGPYNIQWSNNKTTWSQLVKPTTTTSFAANVVDNNNCTASKSVTITIFPNPIADFVTNPSDLISEGETVVFNNTSSLSNFNTWDLGDGNAGPDKPMFSHIYENEGKYCIELTATTINGCTDNIVKCVEVVPAYSVYMPNSFTPNGDKTNPVFRVVARGFETMTLSVFNRWGEELIFLEGNQPALIGWDGNYKGNPAPEGTYAYRVEVKDLNGRTHSYFGYINLIR